MDFRGDERGQPVVIGALLVFAILILAFSGYQAFVVPNQNADVEFSHSQQVQDDMVDLRVGIVRAAISGSDTSTSVRLGTQYPSRLIALNPPPPSGTLRTTDAGDIVIDGSNPQNIDICPSPATTRSLIYEPNYHEFQDGPDLVYENTFAYSQFQDDTELLRTNERLVDTDDQVIELIALEGEFEESGTHRIGIDFIRGETHVQEVTNPEITLPTEVVNRETWEEDVLGEEVDSFETGGSVTFSFTGTYEVRCTPVGINEAPASGSHDIVRTGDDGGGSGGSSTGPASFTTATADDIGGSASESQTFTVGLNEDVESGYVVEINLDDAHDTRGGGNTDVQYPDDVSMISTTGTGTTSIESTTQSYSIFYTVGSGDSGSEIEITVDDVDASEGNNSPYTVNFSMENTTGDVVDTDDDAFSIV